MGAAFTIMLKGAKSAHTFIKIIFSAVLISALSVLAIKDGMFDTFDSAKTGLFVLVCAAIWMGLFDSVLEVCGKRKALERDFFSGQSRLSYVLALVAFQTLRAFIQAVILFLFSYQLINMPTTEGLQFNLWQDYLISLFLIVWASEMLGIGISSLAGTSIGALKASPLVLIYQLIISATLVEIPDFLNRLSGTTICRWGLEALGSLFDINSLSWLVEVQYPQYEFYNSHDMSAYAATSMHLCETWIWLLVLGVICILVAYVGLLGNRQLR